MRENIYLKRRSGGSLSRIFLIVLYITILLNVAVVSVSLVQNHLIQVQQLRVDNLKKDIEILELKKELLDRSVKEEKTTPISPWDEMQEQNKQTWQGTASYYSVAGCVGCREDLLMANGEKFDENALTLAFNWLPLNTHVTVKNLSSNTQVTAKITDTGGFNELGRIADLSKGLKEVINCSDLCEVEIKEIK